MRISNSKKQLAEIIHANGGWRDGAESAAQCVGGEVSFWHNTATKRHGENWSGSYLGQKHDIEFTGVKLPNWHQTILSRDEYFHLYPAPDAEAEQKAEIRWVRGKDIYATPTAHDCMEMLKEKLGSTECGCDECSAFYSKPVAHAESTIEQLAADYRNAKDFADRKQQEADAAKADAEAKLAELVAVGRALGLGLSVAGAQKYTGKFYSARLGVDAVYDDDTNDVICDECGRRWGEHYEDESYCKPRSERENA